MFAIAYPKAEVQQNVSGKPRKGRRIIELNWINLIDYSLSLFLSDFAGSFEVWIVDPKSGKKQVLFSKLDTYGPGMCWIIGKFTTISDRITSFYSAKNKAHLADLETLLESVTSYLLNSNPEDNDQKKKDNSNNNSNSNKESKDEEESDEEKPEVEVKKKVVRRHRKVLLG